MCACRLQLETEPTWAEELRVKQATEVADAVAKIEELGSGMAHVPHELLRLQENVAEIGRNWTAMNEDNRTSYTETRQLIDDIKQDLRASRNEVAGGLDQMKCDYEARCNELAQVRNT